MLILDQLAILPIRESPMYGPAQRAIGGEEEEEEEEEKEGRRGRGDTHNS